MDAWGWQQLQPWLNTRLELPVGPLFCIVTGTTRGRDWANAAARADLRRMAARAGVRRRLASHQLRHAHAVEMADEGIPLVVIQRQLGHSNLGITSICLQGIEKRRDHRHRPRPADSDGASQRPLALLSTRESINGPPVLAQRSTQSPAGGTVAGRQQAKRESRVARSAARAGGRLPPYAPPAHLFEAAGATSLALRQLTAQPGGRGLLPNPRMAGGPAARASERPIRRRER